MAIPQCFGITREASPEPAIEPTMLKQVVSKASTVATIALVIFEEADTPSPVNAKILGAGVGAK